MFSTRVKEQQSERIEFSMTDLREVRVVQTYPHFSLASWAESERAVQRTGRSGADLFAEMRRRKDGKVHAYWALVEGARTARGPRQRVVAH